MTQKCEVFYIYFVHCSVSQEMVVERRKKIRQSMSKCHPAQRLQGFIINFRSKNRTYQRYRGKLYFIG